MADNNAPPPVPVTPAPATQATPTPHGLFSAEPVAAKAVVGILAAIVAYLVSRGFLGDAEQALSNFLIPVVAAAITAWWTRQSVTPMARAQDAIELAYTAEPGVGAKPVI